MWISICEYLLFWSAILRTYFVPPPPRPLSKLVNTLEFLMSLMQCIRRQQKYIPTYLTLPYLSTLSCLLTFWVCTPYRTAPYCTVRYGTVRYIEHAYVGYNVDAPLPPARARHQHPHPSIHPDRGSCSSIDRKMQNASFINVHTCRPFFFFLTQSIYRPTLYICERGKAERGEGGGGVWISIP